MNYLCQSVLDILLRRIGHTYLHMSQYFKHMGGQPKNLMSAATAIVRGHKNNLSFDLKTTSGNWDSYGYS